MIKNIDYFGDINRNADKDPTAVVKTLHLKNGNFDLTYGFYSNCKRALHYKLPIKQFLACVYDAEDGEDIKMIMDELFATN